MRRFLFCLFTFATVCTCGLRAEESKLSITSKVGFESAYVSYGTKFAENVVVPMVDISKGDLYAGVWGYLPIDKGAGGYVFDGEWDFFVGQTIQVNDRLSIDAGVTVYQYPGVDVDSVTLEGFLWLSLKAPLNPKLKLYYDFTNENWIGELAVDHTFSLNKQWGVLVGGFAGFRKNQSVDRWFYATMKADLIYSYSEKTQFSIGVRGTDNTDHLAVGHGSRAWYGVRASHTF